MLRAIIHACVHRRFAVVGAALVLLLLGVHAYLRTPIEAYPDVTNVQVNVIAQMPGQAPEEIERQVTVPLERALNGLPGMIQLRSESLFGLALVFLTFEDGADSFKTRALVAERAADANLPDGVEPVLAPDDTPLGEIFQYRLISDRHSLYDLRSEQEYTVTRVLRQVHGVADVVSFGGYLKELHVEVDPSRLQAHGLTLTDVSTALTRSNLNVGGGFLRHGDQELVVRGIGYLKDATDIEDIVLRSEGGTPITIGDVARVILSATPRRGAVGLGTEKESIEGFVLLRRGENPSDVLDGVHEKVKELNEKILPQGMKIEPFYDRTTLVGHTLETVHHSLLFGALLIVSVVWLFLRTVRGSLIVAVVIPLSLLTAFTGLWLLGLPANLISMGAIDFGILVDGAVILVENVVHETRVHRPKTRMAMLKLVAHSALDVSRPTFYAMAIIIAALIPVFTLQRVEGRIFRPLALTYSFALVAALVFSFTVVPALCALGMRPGDADIKEPKLIEKLRALYARALAVIVRNRSIAVLGGLALLFAGGVVGKRLGTEFLPQLDEGDVVIFVEMPPSIALREGQSILVDVRSRLLQFPEVIATMSEEGRPEDGTDDEGVNMSETFVRLRPRETWRPEFGKDKDKLVEAMRASLEEIPGVRYNFSQPIKDNVEEAVSGVRGQVVLKIFGPDLDKMRDTLDAAKTALSKLPGVVDLDLYRDSMVPQLQVALDRQALAREGIAVGDAQDVIETALSGRIATKLFEGERVVPVRVVLPIGERDDPVRIGEISIPSSSGARIPLRDLAHLDVAIGRAGINREANSRYMALKFNVEGRDLGSVIKDARAIVDKEVKPPDGHFFVWGGEFENQQRAMARLKLVVPIALLVILVLLYSALSSGRSAMAILFAAPFAMTGGIFSLELAHIVLSVSAVVGFIALLGQVSLAGLLVLSAIETRRRDGQSLESSLVDGGATRFRALLMTAFLAILGLLPMAISTGVGSETQRPFSVVIIGGMVTTLLVALFVLPVIYSFITPRVLKTPEEAEQL